MKFGTKSIKLSDNPQGITKAQWKLNVKGMKDQIIADIQSYSFKNVNVNHLDGFARNVAVALNVAKKIMEFGYNGSKVSPVNRLSPSKFPKEYINGGESAAPTGQQLAATVNGLSVTLTAYQLTQTPTTTLTITGNDTGGTVSIPVTLNRDPALD